jgi:hypothetical protein
MEMCWFAALVVGLAACSVGCGGRDAARQENGGDRSQPVSQTLEETIEAKRRPALVADDEQGHQNVLRDQPEWTEPRITEAMHAGVERPVKLKQPLPVYLTYFTAWEENGKMQFRGDVYGLERTHRAAGS